MCAYFLLEVGDESVEMQLVCVTVRVTVEMQLVCVTVRVTVEVGTTTGKKVRACKKKDRRNY